MSRLQDRYVLFYPMRIVGSSFLMLLIVLHTWQFGILDSYEITLLGYLLVHPHIVRLLVLKNFHNRAKIENGAFLIDAFLLGIVVHLNQFSLLPSLILVTVALVNALSVNGFGQMMISGMVVLSGILAPMPFLGLNFDPKSAFGVNLACSVFLFIYFNFFAYSAYNRSRVMASTS